MIKKAAALGRDAASHPCGFGNGRHHVITVEHQTTRSRKAAEGVAQRLALAAADIGNQSRTGKIIGIGEGLVPVIGKMRHELVENASFVRMPAQIIEAVDIPSRLMRYPVCESHV